MMAIHTLGSLNLSRSCFATMSATATAPTHAGFPGVVTNEPSQPHEDPGPVRLQTSSDSRPPAAAPESCQNLGAQAAVDSCAPSTHQQTLSAEDDGPVTKLQTESVGLNVETLVVPSRGYATACTPAAGPESTSHSVNASSAVVAPAVVSPAIATPTATASAVGAPTVAESAVGAPTVVLDQPGSSLHVNVENASTALCAVAEPDSAAIVPASRSSSVVDSSVLAHSDAPAVTGSDPFTLSDSCAPAVEQLLVPCLHATHLPATSNACAPDTRRTVGVSNGASESAMTMLPTTAQSEFVSASGGDLAASVCRVSGNTSVTSSGIAAPCPGELETPVAALSVTPSPTAVPESSTAACQTEADLVLANVHVPGNNASSQVVSSSPTVVDTSPLTSTIARLSAVKPDAFPPSSLGVPTANAGTTDSVIDVPAPLRSAPLTRDFNASQGSVSDHRAPSCLAHPSTATQSTASIVSPVTGAEPAPAVSTGIPGNTSVPTASIAHARVLSPCQAVGPTDGGTTVARTVGSTAASVALPAALARHNAEITSSATAFAEACATSLPSSSTPSHSISQPASLSGTSPGSCTVGASLALRPGASATAGDVQRTSSASFFSNTENRATLISQVSKPGAQTLSEGFKPLSAGTRVELGLLSSGAGVVKQCPAISDVVPVQSSSGSQTTAACVAFSRTEQDSTGVQPPVHVSAIPTSCVGLLNSSIAVSIDLPGTSSLSKPTSPTNRSTITDIHPPVLSVITPEPKLPSATTHASLLPNGPPSQSREAVVGSHLESKVAASSSELCAGLCSSSTAEYLKPTGVSSLIDASLITPVETGQLAVATAGACGLVPEIVSPTNHLQAARTLPPPGASAGLSTPCVSFPKASNCTVQEFMPGATSPSRPKQTALESKVNSSAGRNQTHQFLSGSLPKASSASYSVPAVTLGECTLAATASTAANSVPALAGVACEFSPSISGAASQVGVISTLPVASAATGSLTTCTLPVFEAGTVPAPALEGSSTLPSNTTVTDSAKAAAGATSELTVGGIVSTASAPDVKISEVPAGANLKRLNPGTSETELVDASGQDDSCEARLLQPGTGDDKAAPGGVEAPEIPQSVSNVAGNSSGSVLATTANVPECGEVKVIDVSKQGPSSLSVNRDVGMTLQPVDMSVGVSTVQVPCLNSETCPLHPSLVLSSQTEALVRAQTLVHAVQPVSVPAVADRSELPASVRGSISDVSGFVPLSETTVALPVSVGEIPHTFAVASTEISQDAMNPAAHLHIPHEHVHDHSHIEHIHLHHTHADHEHLHHTHIEHTHEHTDGEHELHAHVHEAHVHIEHTHAGHEHLEHTHLEHHHIHDHTLVEHNHSHIDHTHDHTHGEIPEHTHGVDENGEAVLLPPVAASLSSGEALISTGPHPIVTQGHVEGCTQGGTFLQSQGAVVAQTDLNSQSGVLVDTNHVLAASIHVPANAVVGQVDNSQAHIGEVHYHTCQNSRPHVEAQAVAPSSVVDQSVLAVKVQDPVGIGVAGAVSNGGVLECAANVDDTILTVGGRQQSTCTTTHGMNSGGGRVSTKRYHATAAQLASLLRVFEQNQSPSAETLHNLSNSTGMPLQNLVLWFKNRRARATKRSASTPSNGRRSYVKSGIYSKKRTAMLVADRASSPFSAPHVIACASGTAVTTGEVLTVAEPTTVPDHVHHHIVPHFNHHHHDEGSATGVQQVDHLRSRTTSGAVSNMHASGEEESSHTTAAKRDAPDSLEDETPFKRSRSEYTEVVGEENPCFGWDSDTCLSKFSAFLAASTSSRGGEQIDGAKQAARKFFYDEMQSGLTITSSVQTLMQSLGELERVMDAISCVSGTQLSSGPRVILREFVAQIRSGKAAAIVVPSAVAKAEEIVP